MRFSFITLAFSLAASVRAATLGKRATIQDCVKDLTKLDAQVLVLNNTLSTFTSSAGYSGALTVHSSEKTLEEYLDAANMNCCSLSDVSDADAKEVLTEVTTLVPDIISALTILNSKKPEFDAIFLANLIVTSDIRNLKTKNAILDTCLYNAAPTSVKPTAQKYINQVKDMFAKAYTTWSI